MSDDAAIPTRPDEIVPDADVTFDAPWQARAFAIAVALYDESEGADWETFQGRLVDRLDRVDSAVMDEAVENVYYEQWLDALLALLVDEGAITPGELDRRKAEFSAGERDATEFVPGETDH